MNLQLAILLFATASVPAREVVTSVDEVRSVHLEHPPTLYRDGKPIVDQDLLLLQVSVADLTPFLPRDAPEGRVMLGHGVCETVKYPVTTPGLVVLCPKPQAGDPDVVWHVESLFMPTSLDAARTKQQLDRHDPSRLVKASSSRKQAEGGTFADLQALKRSLAPAVKGKKP